MIDRRNRLVVTIFGFVLLVGGGLALLLSVGVFGNQHSQEAVLDRTAVHWWHDAGSGSYAVVGAVGFLLFIVGVILATGEWRRNDGRSRTSTIVFPADGRAGQTDLRTPSLSHTLESDLTGLPHVGKALVGLFGAAPTVELRSVLDVTDDVDLKELSGEFAEALSRVQTTVGFRPAPVQVTLRFSEAKVKRGLD